MDNFGICVNKQCVRRAVFLVARLKQQFTLACTKRLEPLLVEFTNTVGSIWLRTGNIATFGVIDHVLDGACPCLPGRANPGRLFPLERMWPSIHVVSQASTMY